MDIQEANVIMAKLLKMEKNFYEENLAGRRPISIDSERIYQKNMSTFRYLQSQTREFGNVLAASPEFFDIMEPWVIYVTGKEGVSKESVNKTKKTADLDHLTDLASNLAINVKKFIRLCGYFICDMGAGEDGWDVGVRANERDSRELCSLLNEKFKEAINADLIRISRRFGQNKLPGLYDYDDAERVLMMYGDNL